MFPRYVLSIRFIAFCFTCLLCTWQFTAQATEQIDIGVLSYRTLEETAEAWSPTANWLEKELPEYRFRIVPFYFEELTQAIAQRRVSFVLTNPEHFVLLHADHGLTAVATLMSRAGQSPSNKFGGVIFTKAVRKDLQRLSDLKGKRISAVSKDSLGGYLAQHWTLYKAGIDPLHDLKLSFTGMPQNAVVEEVFAGKADAGFVRTGILERDIQLGRLKVSDIRVLNPHTESGFPLMLSTDLYPEWPFATMPGVSPDLEKAVTLALLNMPPESDAAVKGDYFGFSPPANYADVEALMVRLDLHPYRDEFDWHDVFNKYARWFVLLLFLIALATLLVARHFRKTNRALNGALAMAHELAQQRNLLLASLGEGVYGIDRDGICTFINPAAVAMLGYRLDEVIGKNQHTLFHHSRSDGLPYPHQECPVYLTLHDGIRRDLNETFIRQNNEMFPVRMTATPIRDGQEITGAVVVFQDITDEMQRLQRLRLLETAVNATANSVVITDQNGTIEWINPAMSRLTGYSLKEAVGQNPRVLKSGAHEDTYYAGLWQTISAGHVWHGDVVNKRKDGTLYFEEMTITPVLNDTGSILHYIAVKQDVSERKRLERELQQLATTDPLTGTANRRHFLNRVEDELQRLKRYDGGAALLMLDLDHFKRVNDTWGHAIGDKILRHFTVLAQEHLRGTDLLGRLGGEEFAVLLPGTDLTGAVGLAERLRHHVASSPVSVASEDITYTVSIGVTMINLKDMSPDDALARSDEALYRAKTGGRNRVEQSVISGP